MAYPTSLTSEQLRAARVVLRWDQGVLARLAKVSTATIKRLEGQDGVINANHSTVEILRSTLEWAGIEFLDEEDRPGLRFKVEAIRRSHELGEHQDRSAKPV